jgi:hypothetical protein
MVSIDLILDVSVVVASAWIAIVLTASIGELIPSVVMMRQKTLQIVGRAILGCYCLKVSIRSGRHR